MTDEVGVEESQRDFLQAVYSARFTEAELHDKRQLWGVVVKNFLQELVPPSATVLDLGAGNCEFINAVQCGTKIAVDLNPDTARLANPDVQVLGTSSERLDGVEDASVDVVFTSNFFEHLPTKAALLTTLSECRRVLKVDGTIMVLMPNIRFLPGAYWDYLDHHIPLTHESLAEALTLAGFRVTRVIPRFLPYTVRNSRIRPRPWLLRIYLRCKPAWWLMGRQMFVLASAPLIDPHQRMIGSSG